MFRASVAILRAANRFQQQCGCQQIRNFSPRFGRSSGATTVEFKNREDDNESPIKSEHFVSSKNNDDDETRNSPSSGAVEKSTKTIIRSFHEKINDIVRPNTQNSFRLLKFYIDDKKPVDDPLLLFHGLIGAAKSNAAYKFLDIYDSWWTMLKENLHNFSVDALCEIVEYLGGVNSKTRGNLRRKLLAEHIDILLAEITKFNFVDELSFRSLGCLYGGLQRLCSFHESGNPKNEYPNKALVTKTVEFLKNAAKEKDEYHTIVTCAIILDAMSRINYAFDRNSLQVFVDILKKPIFDQKNIKESSFDTFFQIAKIQIRFAESFGRYRVNPDEISKGSWSNWFLTVKKVFEISGQYENVSTVQHGDDIDENQSTSSNAINVDRTTAELHRMRNRQNLASIIVKLCTQVLDVMTKFGKQQEFLDTDFKNTWHKMIVNNVPYANRIVVFHLHSRLRAAEVYLKSQLPFDSQATELVGENVWDMIRKAANEERDERNRRKQQYYQDSYDKSSRRDGSSMPNDEDFGGGFRSFSRRTNELNDQRSLDNANRRQNQDNYSANRSRSRFEFDNDHRSTNYRFSRRFDNREDLVESNRSFRNPPRRDEPLGGGRRRNASVEMSYKPSNSDISVFRGRTAKFSRSDFTGNTNQQDEDYDEDQRDNIFVDENTRRTFSRRDSRHDQGLGRSIGLNPKRRSDKPDDLD